eukprot:TRINITY_DN1485_c0_g1_i3.p1 TRINITY_DN1485_c0_g1~~TRINITY_DN1485_c0_g1_i3.p1  ORF type:complete len:799 (-),score=283.12 TRINITY_DN1485_c0_g1_i3:25-2421(-)
MSAEEEEDTMQLMWRLKDPQKGLTPKDRKYHLKTYKNCFQGKEVVDWLLEKKVCMSREEAAQRCEDLVQKNLLTNVIPAKHGFKDSDRLFTFVSREPVAQEEDDEVKLKYRLLLLGGERSGKSALAQRFCKNEFTEEYQSTTEEVYRRRESFPVNNEKVNVETLDTQFILEDLETKLQKWSQWATGYLLIFNISSRASFEVIPKMFNTLIKTRQFRVTPVILVGTRADMESERKINKDEAQNLASRYRCRYIETSAKTGDNVNDAFSNIVQSINAIQFMAGPVQHKQGWMRIKKKGGQSQKRYLLMTDSGLRYYSEQPASLSDTSNLKGIIPMQNCQVDTLPFGDDVRRHSDFDAVKKKKSLTTEQRRASDSDNQILKSQSSDNSTPPRSPAISMLSLDEMTSHKENTATLRKSDSSSSSSRSNLTLTRSKSKHQLKIYIIDNTENYYEVTASSIEERDDWYSQLLKISEKSLSRNEISENETDVDSPETLATLSEEELMTRAIMLFNKKPVKGVEMLTKMGKISENPESVAQFLYNTKGLKKSCIGEYIGGNDPFKLKVLTEFCNRMNFGEISFDEAIRLYLSKFTLPREAQQIDRIMEHFAARFCHCNPSSFENNDVGYILAFSLIMLNTDAHNPNIPRERKMTKEQFVNNNRGINNGKDLQSDYLMSLYDNIVSRPFEKDHERAEFFQWDKQGWLAVKEMKKSESTRRKPGQFQGKKQWCIISGSCLFIFENPEDKKPFHIIPLDNLEIDSLVDADSNSNHIFVLYNPDPRGSIKSAAEGSAIQLKELYFTCDSR